MIPLPLVSFHFFFFFISSSSSSCYSSLSCYSSYILLSLTHKKGACEGGRKTPLPPRRNAMQKRFSLMRTFNSILCFPLILLFSFSSSLHWFSSSFCLFLRPSSFSVFLFFLLHSSFLIFFIHYIK